MNTHTATLQDKLSRSKAQLLRVLEQAVDAPIEEEIRAALVRQWTLLRTLESRPRTLRELSVAQHQPTSQVQRDLSLLERAGFPIYDYRDDFGRHWWGVLRRAPARREGDRCAATHTGGAQ